MTSEANLIRILVVDDHHVVRQGIAGLIATESDMSVVGQAATVAKPCSNFARCGRTSR
jgi:DNA-binding NarL/FixJ family response regulator